MEHKDKIKRLIQSRTGPNNRLAIQLMQSLWNYNFAQAFLTLELYQESLGLYLIDLLDLKIRYFHDHDIMLDYIQIRRTIHYQNKLLKEYSMLVYGADPWQHQGVSNGLNKIEYKAILEDLKLIAPTIEELL